MSDAKGFTTRAIHHAYDPMQNEGALTPPVHLTSTFVFENAEAGGEMFAGEREGQHARVEPAVGLGDPGPEEACVRDGAGGLHVVFRVLVRVGGARAHDLVGDLSGDGLELQGLLAEGDVLLHGSGRVGARGRAAVWPPGRLA